MKLRKYPSIFENYKSTLESFKITRIPFFFQNNLKFYNILKEEGKSKRIPVILKNFNGIYVIFRN